MRAVIPARLTSKGDRVCACISSRLRDEAFQLLQCVREGRCVSYIVVVEAEGAPVGGGRPSLVFAPEPVIQSVEWHKMFGERIAELVEKVKKKIHRQEVVEDRVWVEAGEEYEPWRLE